MHARKLKVEQLGHRGQRDCDLFVESLHQDVVSTGEK
jgi:hypothetical protein